MSSIFQIFASWRMAVTFLMAFSSGIPLALTATTLQAWMASEKIDLTIIGIFSLVGLPYTLKFFWAPIIDRYSLPFLGHRRGWLAFFQLLLMAAIVALGFSDPKNAPGMTALFAVIVAFASASQDIVIDAYRTELLTEEERGPGSGIYYAAYRIAMLVSGGVALMLSDLMPWKSVYFIMAGTIGIGFITTLFAPEPKNQAPAPRSIRDAVVLPFREFFARKGAIEMLVFLILYKLDVALTLAMMTPFLIETGFSKTEIGAVFKGFGMVATIVGGLFSGGLMVRLGTQRALWLFGISQAISGLSFMALAHLGKSYPMMVTAITIESLCSGMGNTAFTAFMMSLCDRRFTATQYALISSFMALSRYISGAASGFIVHAVGWEFYYLICALAGIPGLLLLTRYKKWTLPSYGNANN